MEYVIVCSLKDLFIVGSLSNIYYVFFITLEFGKRITIFLEDMWNVGGNVEPLWEYLSIN